ncbi:hypothetical protein DFJ73DRAFT_808758, partial [Zopfochytrium polystomum]
MFSPSSSSSSSTVPVPPPSAGQQYLSAAMGPSRHRARKFCGVCGDAAKYACVRCGTAYCAIGCRDTHLETRCLRFA